MNKDKLQKLLAKKRNLPEAEKKAKMDVVKGLSDDMADHMHKRMGGLRKVEVASDSPEGLKAGLDMAKKASEGDSNQLKMNMGGIVPGHDKMDEPEEEGEKYMDADKDSQPEPEESSSPDEEASEQDHEHAEDMDLDAIKEKIEHLMALQRKMESK